LLGVSTDDAASHEKFRDKFALNFRLLSDVDHKLAEQVRRIGARESASAKSRWASNDPRSSSMPAA